MPQDPYKYFRIEARELCEQLGKGALELEKGASGEEHVSRLLRLAHTLKGAARVVKQREIADLAHAIEDALEPFRQGDRLASRALIDALLAKLDVIKGLLAALDEPERAAAVPQAAADSPRPIVKALIEEPTRSVRAELSELDTLLSVIAEAQASLSGLGRTLEGFERVEHVVELLAEQLGMLRTAGFASATSARSLSILEELRNLLANLRGGLSTGLEQADRELRQARAGTELLRLVPASALFNVLERTARDAAQSLAKEVAFEAKGGEIRLDAHVMDVMQSALVQLVRNAVAHGIEAPAERRAQEKPAHGTITLQVLRRGGRVGFSCRDDGRGVDVDAVRRVAHARGERVERGELDPAKLLTLLMRGGISTSTELTYVAGRGVGLDVVREAVGQLGGEITLRTEPGKGTTLEIWVAASLTSFDALFVEADRQTALLPLDVVRKTVRVRVEEVARTGDGESIALDGKIIPFTTLSRSLHRGSESVRARPAWTTVIVESLGALAAVGVDRLLGTENVVFCALPRLCPAAPVIAGTSFDAEGTPQIVLDAAALVASAQRGRAPVPVERRSKLPILVIDDSLTTRMLEQSILESAGYEVDLASSGEEGLEKAKKRRYGLLLVDVEMPAMDGFEVISKLRADPDLRDVPAILVTSRNAPRDFQRGKEVGASGHIVKGSFDQTDFLKRIRVLME